MTKNPNVLPLVASLAALLFFSCQSPTASTPTARDVSTDMASLGADLSVNQTTAIQTSMIDETTSTVDSSTTASLAPSRVVGSATIAVTVSHTVTTPVSASSTLFLSGDVAQVTRSWTSWNGNVNSDVITRPHIPFEAVDYQGTPTYQPVASTSISTTGISAVFSQGIWTLTGSEVKSVNGIPLSTVTYTWFYQWDSVNQRAELLRMVIAGEQVGPYTGKVKLNTEIWYTYNATSKKDQEFVRVVDFVPSGGVTPLKRLVYATNLQASVLGASATLPTLWDSSLSTGTTATTLTALPAVTPLSTSTTNPTTIDLWYYSDPSVPLTSLNPVYSGTSLATYPKWDVARWMGVVLQENSPRIADWYKPIATTGVFLGNYTRRFEVTTSQNSSSRAVYSLTDGVTEVNMVASQVYASSSGGTLTTTRKFSDGITSTVTITPQYSASDAITGYVIVRGTTTYTVQFTTYDAGGELTGLTVTNSTTNKTTSYTETNGVWTAS